MAKCLSRCFFLLKNIVFISHILRMLSSTILIVLSFLRVSLIWLPARQCLFLICLPFARLASMCLFSFFYCHVDLCSVLLQKFTFSWGVKRMMIQMKWYVSVKKSSKRNVQEHTNTDGEKERGRATHIRLRRLISFMLSPKTEFF